MGLPGRASAYSLCGVVRPQPTGIVKLSYQLRLPARIGLFSAWAPIVALMPIVALALHRILPTGLQSLLFFWPQAAVPYNTFHGAPPHVGARVWPGLWVAYWLAIAILFGVGTRRVRGPWAFFLAGAVIVVFTIALQLLLAATGLYFELDGP